MPAGTLPAVLLAIQIASAPRAAFSSNDAPPPAGIYRAVVQSRGGELPFQMELTRSGDRLGAVLINGPERAHVDQVAFENGELTLKWTVYGNVLRARLEGEELVGTLELLRRGGRIDKLPVRARLAGHRFFPEPDPAASRFEGRFDVTFTRADGTSYPAVGEFKQEGATVTGTFLTETGDFRFLAGEAKGNQLYLSVFYGGTPALYLATRDSGGSLSGDRWSGSAGHESWKAHPNPNAALRDPQKITFLKPGHDRLEFTFPNLDGRPVSLSDPRYRGKVVVVTISGSWCPNCHDESAFMAPFYRENRERGLESIALMYEYSGNFDEAAALVRRFKEKFGIEYELLIAGVSDKEQASQTLPMLSEVYAYPTTLVLDRRGQIRLIHTGFSGPGTGEHYTRYVREFSELIERLLAEETE
jgi:peroxiredoxin